MTKFSRKTQKVGFSKIDTYLVKSLVFTAQNQEENKSS